MRHQRSDGGIDVACNRMPGNGIVFGDFITRFGGVELRQLAIEISVISQLPAEFQQPMRAAIGN